MRFGLVLDARADLIRKTLTLFKLGLGGKLASGRQFIYRALVAETDQRVQIRIGARSLTATGMLASLKDNELQLKSNVSGKFVP